MRNPSMVPLKSVLDVLWRDTCSKRPFNLTWSLRKEHCARFWGISLDISGKNNHAGCSRWCNNSHLICLPSQFLLVNRMNLTSRASTMQLFGFSRMWKPLYFPITLNFSLLKLFTQGAFGFGFLSILWVPLLRERKVWWPSRLEGTCLELGVYSWKNAKLSSYQEVPSTAYK